MKVSPNIVEEFDMYLRSGGGFHGGVPYGRAGLAGNRPLMGFATHRAANTPSAASAERSSSATDEQHVARTDAA